ncbi:MAG: hypothetical protein JNM80_14755 [Phycisphaerae bacterium]|nr:hypothetical protein [Phycisphaerae bacterium]
MRPLAIAAVAVLSGFQPPEPNTPASTPVAQQPAPTSTPAPRSFADFRPSIHGFRFVNSFTGSPLPVRLGNAERSMNVPNRFGLCGGMSFAAADFFLARRDRPLADVPPAQGDPLYDFLYGRQVASLGTLGVMATKFMEWMRLSDDECRRRTLDELPEITRRLAEGKPEHLGLVLTSAARNPEPWHNHQVLAYALGEGPEGVTVIRIYDPNYPERDDATLVLGTPGESIAGTRVVPGKRPTIVRGVFRMSYTPVKPPESLSPPTAPAARQ